MTLIDDIMDKTKEIERLNSFIQNMASQAQDQRWETYDPGYVNIQVVYTSAKAALIALVNSLP